MNTRNLKKALAALSASNRALETAKKSVAAATEIVNQMIAEASAIGTAGALDRGR